MKRYIIVDCPGRRPRKRLYGNRNHDLSGVKLGDECAGGTVVWVTDDYKDALAHLDVRTAPLFAAKGAPDGNE